MPQQTELGCDGIDPQRNHEPRDVPIRGACELVEPDTSLTAVFSGWTGYQLSIEHAIASLTDEQLLFTTAPAVPTIGQIAEHIASGRAIWISRMQTAASVIASELTSKYRSAAGDVQPDVCSSVDTLCGYLAAGRHLVEAALEELTVADLETTYLHDYQGKTYAVTRQWTLWRVMAHDIHHGGQLTVQLYALGMEPRELCSLGGHIVEPDLYIPG